MEMGNAKLLPSWVHGRMGLVLLGEWVVLTARFTGNMGTLIGVDGCW